MPRLTAPSDTLAGAGALTASDAPALDAAGAVVRAAGPLVLGALPPDCGALVTAVGDYARVDGVYAAALADAVRTFGAALSEAAEAYRQSETVVTGWFRSAGAA